MRSATKDKLRDLAREGRIRRRLRGWLGFGRSVPVLQQLSSVECGAACLAMVLSYYGRRTRVAEIRDLCSVGRDGLSALSIVNAARGYGLRTRACTVEPHHLRDLASPSIVHWGFNHFIVLEKWSPERVVVVDPAQGRRILTASEFSESFTGIVLTFEPGSHFQSSARAAGTASLRTYFQAMFSGASARGLLAQILTASLLLQAFGLIVPLFTKVLVDQVVPLKEMTLLTALGLSAVVMMLAQAVTFYMRNVFLIYLRGRLDSQLMLGFVEHLLSLPFRFFQQRTTGDLLMRLNSNSFLREVITNQTVSAVLDGFFLLVYLSVLLMAAPGFGVLVVALALLQALILLGTRRRMHGLMQRDLGASAVAQAYLVEAIGGVGYLKASGAEDRAMQHWSDLFFTQLNISLERAHVSAVIETAVMALRTVTPLLLLWMGALYVLRANVSIGTMLALNAIATAFLTPLGTLIANGQQLQVVGAHLERISDILEAEPEQPGGQGASNLNLSGGIELRDVSFRFNPDSPLVLKSISCVIKPGQKVAVVGPTGSGKSTLALLLLGLLRPTSGQVLFDGLPQDKMNYRSLRTHFGVVMQEPTVFSDSIRQNIAFGNTAISIERVIRASILAAIHDDIVRMPMGYETVISEAGSNLSGGQRQRLALARALAGEPKFLILDEATSHLDAITEAAVDDNLSSLLCTRIVIAHRLSTIRNADQILVLKEGALVEQGTHEHLVMCDGFYADLLRSQTGALVEDELSLAELA